MFLHKTREDTVVPKQLLTGLIGFDLLPGSQFSLQHLFVPNQHNAFMWALHRKLSSHLAAAATKQIQCAIYLKLINKILTSMFDPLKNRVVIYVHQFHDNLAFLFSY